MRLTSPRATVLAWTLSLMCLASSAIAQETEVSGVKYPTTIAMQGSPLQLNGAGTRFKAVFKVYTAGLYVGQKADTPEALMASSGPKRLHITMLREIDTNELGKLFTRGVEDNTPRGEYARLVPGLIRMGEVFSVHKRLLPGDTFTIDWLPGEGTVIVVKGQAQGQPFKEPEFFQALMRIWLGKNPADHQLKDALLGKKT